MRHAVSEINFPGKHLYYVVTGLQPVPVCQKNTQKMAADLPAEVQSTVLVIDRYREKDGRGYRTRTYTRGVMPGHKMSYSLGYDGHK